MTEPGIPLDYDSWYGSEEEHLGRPLPENPLDKPFTKKKLKQCLALYENAKEGVVHDVLYTATARVEFPRALAALDEAWGLLGYFSKKHYHTYHQDLNYEDREVFRCDECSELEAAAHKEDCPIGKAEAIVRANEEG